MSQNPYERRRGDDAERNPGALMSSGWMDLSNQGPRESPLKVEDLEAMVESAVARSHRYAERPRAEEVRRASLEAWDRGHAVGLEDGKRAMLTTIDQRFGGRVRDLVVDAANTLRECEGTGISEREQVLIHRLAQAHSVAEALIHAHHDGFEEPRIGTSVSFHGTPVRGEPSG